MRRLDRVYRLGLFDMDGYRAWPPPYRARGWTGDLRRYRFKGDPYEIHRDPSKLPDHIKKFNPPWHMVPPRDAKPVPIAGLNDNRTRIRTIELAPELIIKAQNRQNAQQAANLILAGICALLDYRLVDELTALPDPGGPLEDLDPTDVELAPQFRVITGGLAMGCAVAAKASHRKRWANGLARLFTSYRSFSINPIDHHPSYGTAFGIENDPIKHAIYAQSISSAYASIEALGLEVRAHSDRPSMIHGKWNAPVFEDLTNRLCTASINLGEKFVWTTRNSPTRIERRFAEASEEIPIWAKGSIRDRRIDLRDALHRGSLIRSKAAAHGGRGSPLTPSLTVYDVHNVQSLARRLVLESLGFWRKGPVPSDRRSSSDSSYKLKN